MKFRVLQAFNDKHTGAGYRIGDIIEITRERYEEIKQAGDYVALMTDGLEDLKKAELQDILTEYDIEFTDEETKADLIDKITEEI